MVYRDLHIALNDAELVGDLEGPEGPGGIVLFAHGSGSSRYSPRNRFVAERLREHGLATLLVDLLTEEEGTIDQVTRRLRFNIPMLADRIVYLIDWLKEREETASKAIGLFGASTGGGAALMAAADRPGEVGAVVSRGGRPDLARLALPKVQAPTLLIVGERDVEVVKLNRLALDHLHCEKRLEIVPGATHLFEEPGALEEVAERAAGFFAARLSNTSVESRDYHLE